MEQSIPSLAPGVRLRTNHDTEETVLLYPEGVLELNQTSASILMFCDGQRTISEIVEELAEFYESNPAEIEADVLTYLAELKERGLVRY